MKKITRQIITFVLSYVILSLGPVFGQDLSDINPSMNIKQNDLSHKFMLEDYSLKSKKHYNKKKTYFWYKAQKIIATQGGSAGTLLNGKYQSFYKNKQLCEPYKLYDSKDDFEIKFFNAEGFGIRTMSRKLGYSQGTIMRRILYLASLVTRPIYHENNEVYEVDEMWTYVGENHPSSYCWVTYAMNRRTRCIVDVVIGSRNKENLKKVIDSVKIHNPKKIVTDGLQTYPNLVKPTVHDTTRYSNNRIERGNLTLRTHLKRLSRKTICFSKSAKMLEGHSLFKAEDKANNLFDYFC